MSRPIGLSVGSLVDWWARPFFVIHAERRFACVVVPAPSIPSTTINFPRIRTLHRIVMELSSASVDNDNGPEPMEPDEDAPEALDSADPGDTEPTRIRSSLEREVTGGLGG